MKALILVVATAMFTTGYAQAEITFTPIAQTEPGNIECKLGGLASPSQLIVEFRKVDEGEYKKIYSAKLNQLDFDLQVFKKPNRKDSNAILVAISFTDSITGSRGAAQGYLIPGASMEVELDRGSSYEEKDATFLYVSCEMK